MMRREDGEPRFPARSDPQNSEPATMYGGLDFFVHSHSRVRFVSLAVALSIVQIALILAASRVDLIPDFTVFSSR
jgi:hypothetical protein